MEFNNNITLPWAPDDQEVNWPSRLLVDTDTKLHSLISTVIKHILFASQLYILIG